MGWEKKSGKVIRENVMGWKGGRREMKGESDGLERKQERKEWRK